MCFQSFQCVILQQETELMPILGQATQVLNEPSKTASESTEQEKNTTAPSVRSKQMHHTELMSALLNTDSNLKVEDIQDFEL